MYNYSCTSPSLFRSVKVCIRTPYSFVKGGYAAVEKNRGSTSCSSCMYGPTGNVVGLLWAIGLLRFVQATTPRAAPIECRASSRSSHRVAGLPSGPLLFVVGRTVRPCCLFRSCAGGDQNVIVTGYVRCFWLCNPLDSTLALSALSGTPLVITR